MGVLRLFLMWMDHDAQTVATDKAFIHRCITFLAALGEQDFPPKEKEEVIRLRDTARNRFYELKRPVEKVRVADIIIT